MSIYRQAFCDGSCRRIPALLAADIARKRSFFDPAVNTCFFEGLESRSLGVRQPCFGAAFGECPASAAASTNQQKLDRALPQTITNGSDLFASAQFAQLRELDESARRRIFRLPWPDRADLRSRIPTHRNSVQDRMHLWLEHNLVPLKNSSRPANVPAAAEADVDFRLLTARLEAAPLQNSGAERVFQQPLVSCS